MWGGVVQFGGLLSVLWCALHCRQWLGQIRAMRCDFWTLSCFLSAIWVTFGALMWGMTPPLRPDEAIYHLTLPLQYLQHGHFVQIPGHGNTGFPAMGEMLFFWCLAAGSSVAARYVQLLTVWAGFACFHELYPQISWRRWLGAFVLFTTAPIVLWELGCAYVDVIEAVFSVTGFLCAVHWAHNNTRGSQSLYASAWLLGCGAACRYLAMAQLPLWLLGVLWVYRMRAQQGEDMPKRPLVLAMVLAAVPCGAWILHNCIVFHNPLFPFGTAWFSGGIELLPSQREVLAQFLNQHGPMDGQSPRQGLDALLHLPYAVFFDAAFSSPRFDGIIGFVPLVAIVLFGVRYGLKLRKKTISDEKSSYVFSALLSFGLLRLFIWLSSSWQIRFVIPSFLALCVWLAFVWPPLRREHKMPTGLCTVMLMCTMGMIGLGLLGLRGHMGYWDVRNFGDAQMRTRARLDALPQSGLCSLVDPNGAFPTTMLVWTQRLALWCPGPIWSDSYDESATLVQWLEENQPQGVLDLLHQHQIGFLLVDEAAFGLSEAMRPKVPRQERKRFDVILHAWEDMRLHHLQVVSKVSTTVLYAVR